MTDFNEQLPEDVRDIAERLTEARVAPTPLELDELRGRIHRRVTRSSTRRGTGTLRRSSLAAILAAALMLTSGAGAVIAAGYFGGNSDGNFGGDSHVFQSTSFRHGRDSSFCQYHGPVTITRAFPTFFGILIITITTDCGRLVSVHITFIPFPFHHHHFDPGFGWRFGNGPDQFTNNASVSTTAPSGTTGMTIVSNGSSYTLPFNVDDSSSAPDQGSSAPAPTTTTAPPTTTAPTTTTTPTTTTPPPATTTTTTSTTTSSTTTTTPASTTPATPTTPGRGQGFGGSSNGNGNGSFGNGNGNGSFGGNGNVSFGNSGGPGGHGH